ncbi:echinoderm microtubule-associated protein-like 2 isoform X5 [Crassostrea angulata]|uniref:echinoderm microtubule-associated protein-like 2 isoform X5 n=1 Tax=Magallana angulata TaxID=2784310 RepID=UPI0005C3A72B|nr:echinoderm microtubule-associated protein-like 2 isoform X5 [Crassostrea angulata]|eukprot:XP_011425882.1 PREDICTED: echinoderm microtubule-associated protein-like 2 isoform X10 [Crassostrea gigas]
MENHLSASCLDSLPSTQVCSTECSSIDFGFHVSDDKDVLDGLLSQDHGELCQRVLCLEKKVQQQEDEIICLKSALADVIRRLGQVEATKAQSSSALPSKPNFRGTPTRRAEKAYSSPLDNAHITPNKRPTTPTHRSAASPRTNTPSKKWSSMSNSLDSSTLHRDGSRDPEWRAEEGYVKIYLRGRAINLYAPTSVENVDVTSVADPPSEKLQLEWVYGYRGRDCRSNLYYLSTGEIIYFAAAAVVLHNVEENTQRHYLGHTDDVKCLAIHPDQVRVATGQVAGHDQKEGKRKAGKKDIPDADKDHWPHVRIWDTMNLNTLHVIGIGDFDKAVSCLSFSRLDGGNQLVVVDDANDHVMSVWDLSKSHPKKITETKSSTEPVLAAEFHPLEKGNIITCGKGQISFWTLEGGSLAKKTGIFDKHDKPKFVLCVAFAENGDVISGDSNGNIFIWPKGNNRISKAIEGVHEGGIFSVCVMKDGTLLSGGGKDRKIVQFDSSYTKTGVETEIPENFGGVRMLNQGKGGMVLVGTTRNCILQGTVDLQLNPIVQGHMDELWGLASHPSQHQFMTSGSDKQVHMWDSMSRSVVWSKELSDPAHSCSFYPDASVVAIGTETGRWLVLDCETHEIVTSHTDGNEQIECALYSPDGKYLALGSRDNHIYIYEVTEGGKKYSRIGKCSGHSSFVTHLDWSTDGVYLCSNSGDYEVLYWKVPACKQETSISAVRDLEWATGNCTLTFNAAGVWPEGADGTDVNNVCRSNNKKILASADDFGKVNLYQYPCCQPKAKKHVYKGHSSHVTNVSFLFDDSRLLSTGGRDMSIMQWQVV